MTIQEILEAHQITKNPEQLYRSFRIACECGETFKGVDTYDATVSHRAHVAEVLEKHMQEAKAEAWEEGWSVGWGNAWDSAKLTGTDLAMSENPYKETE